MNLNELREAMASDATKENEELKRQLKSLQKKYDRETSDLYDKIAALKSDCRALGNRCFAMTQGSMCMFCNLSTMECPHVLNDDQKIRIAKKLMEESKQC